MTAKLFKSSEILTFPFNSFFSISSEYVKLSRLLLFDCGTLGAQSLKFYRSLMEAVLQAVEK